MKRRKGAIILSYAIIRLPPQLGLIDPNLRGAPTGHAVPVREVRLSAGAGFIVAICGEIMTMPGLPRTPAAESIMMNESGEIEGLF